MHGLGRAYTLILHLGSAAGPRACWCSRSCWTTLRTFPGLWFTHGLEL